MADDSSRLRSRQGRFAKKVSINRARNVYNLNTSIPKLFDHAYYRSSVDVSVECKDIDVAQNVSVTTSAPDITWEHGRRVVELSHLAEEMICDKCHNDLHLKDIVGEKRYGLGSLLQVKCRHCEWIKLVSTGKRNDKGGFDGNYKVALAMVHTGMGATHVVNFLSACDIPPPDQSTLRKKEKEISSSVSSEASESCMKASEEEKEASNNNMECSFDGGWQKRGSGWQYNSNSGHASLIGCKTGKVTEYDLRTRSCSICMYHKGRGHNVPAHDCNSNWTGSSKGMEPDMAITMIQKMKAKGCDVKVLHSDNDSTTAARLKNQFDDIIKKDDRNHIKKNLTTQLYGAAKKYKELKPAGVIPAIKRMYMYAIQSHQGLGVTGLEMRLDSVVPHLFGDHNLCTPDWCKYHENPTTYRHKHFPHGKPLTDEGLRERLEEITVKMKKRAAQLVNLGSSQANENFNHMVASKAPKNRTYGSSTSLKTRVSAVVLQKNEGFTWVNKVYKRAKLSPGTISLKIGRTLDKKREYLKKKSSEIARKRKRIAVKKQSVSHEEGEKIKEGATYQSSIGEECSPDIESIPSPYVVSNNVFVVFDLEATGLARSSDITQLSAYDGTSTFNCYIKPRQPISKAASTITGLTYSFENNQMYHNGKPVLSEEPYEAFVSFTEYLQSKDRPILVGHNIYSYDIPIIVSALREHGLLSTVLLSVYGCVDTLPLAKRSIPKMSVPNYKQESLVKAFLNCEYEAHNALEDVKSLFNLFNLKLKSQCSGKDIFPLNVKMLELSYCDVVQKNVVSKQIVRKLSKSGLHYNHIKLAHQRDEVKGVKSVLTQHGLKKATIDKVYKYLDCTEE